MKEEDHSAIAEGRERSQSPEYSQVENVNKHSKDIIVNQENQVTDSEVNTFPNPCYHTQMHAID